MLPVITMLAGTVAWAFSGTVLVEGAFGWPGAGQYALHALENPTFPRSKASCSTRRSST